MRARGVEQHMPTTDELERLHRISAERLIEKMKNPAAHHEVIIQVAMHLTKEEATQLYHALIQNGTLSTVLRAIPDAVLMVRDQSTRGR